MEILQGLLGAGRLDVALYMVSFLRDNELGNIFVVFPEFGHQVLSIRHLKAKQL